MERAKSYRPSPARGPPPPPPPPPPERGPPPPPHPSAELKAAARSKQVASEFWLQPVAAAAAAKAGRLVNRFPRAAPDLIARKGTEEGDARIAFEELMSMPMSMRRSTRHECP